MSSGRRRVLIVDDDESTVEVLKRFLLTKGFETVEAKDGQSAIDLARRIRPDLILLDIMMPDLSGDVVCKALKDDHETAAVPVIMTTAKREREDLINGLDVGADDYVRKPFDVYELLARIKAHLRVRDLYRELTASHLAALVEFLHGMPRGAGVRAILDASLARFGQIFDVAHGAVVLLEGQGRARGVAVAASTDGLLEPGELDLGSLPEVLRAAETGEVAVEGLPEVRGAAIGIPAVLGDRTVAVFRIRTSTDRGQGPTDLLLARSLACAAAPALEAARTTS